MLKTEHGVILTEDEAFELGEVITTLTAFDYISSSRQTDLSLNERERYEATELIANSTPNGLAGIDSSKTQLLASDQASIAAKLAGMALIHRDTVHRLLSTSIRPETPTDPSSSYQLGLQAAAYSALATAAKLSELVPLTES
jgi:hypothetical protein